MTLRCKTLIIIASTVVCAFLILYAAAAFVLTPGFAAIEDGDARQQLRRACAALDNAIQGVDLMSADWSAWDDSYRFVETGDPEFIKSTLLVESFITGDVDVVVYMNPKGKIVFARQVDPRQKKEVPLSEMLKRELVAGSVLVDRNSPDSTLKGVLLTEERPLLVSSRPILHSDRTGPIHGTLVMGKYLDEVRINAMSPVLLQKPAVFWANQPRLPRELRADLETMDANGGAVIRLLSEDQLRCRALVRDIHGRPALILQQTLPREIHKRGQEAILTLLICLLVVGPVFGVVTIRLFSSQIVSRVTALDRTAQQIAGSGDVTRRVPVIGHDELSSLAASFNHMLVALHKAEDDLRHAKEAAENASRLKSRFLANVSHEIRTPLNCIIGFSEAILRTGRGDAVHPQVRTILCESEMLLGMIDDLLDHAKIEAGRLELELRPLNLRRLLQGLYELAVANTRGKSLDVQLQVADALPEYVSSDALRLRQILMNLISNAVKFTETGSVTIAASLCERTLSIATVRFSVSDTGIGIPRHRQEAIFESFTQVDVSTRRKYGGTGLGTTIARQLVTLMGGQMGLESEPGRGSIFWFVLPLEVCPVPVELDSLNETPVCGPRPTAHILLADDYAPIREVIRLHLEEVGHTLKLVENATRLVAASQTARYDLIITDLHMPDMDGYEAARRIRDLPGLCRGTPIIALSADAETGSRERCRDSGINELLLKPIRRDTLLAAVERWLAASRRDEARAVCRIDADPAGRTISSEVLPIDYAMASAEFGGEETVDRVVAQFLANLREQIDLMRNALAEGQMAILRRESHGIRGAASTLVAAPLAEIAGRMQCMIDKGGAETENVASVFGELVDAARRLDEFVAAHAGSKPRQT